MTLDRRGWLSLVAVLALGALATAVFQRLPPPARPLERTPVVVAVLDDAGSPRAGTARPDVTIVVFTDYKCPICRATDPALARLLAEDPGVQVIFKDWPVLGERSKVAARLALASAVQGRYPAFHAALMAEGGGLSDAEIERAAATADVDWSRLQRDLAANAERIDRQLDGHGFQAWSLGLQGTPAYLVGPYLIQGGLDAGGLKRAVRKARASGGWR